jgi:hypothetical protein
MDPVSVISNLAGVIRYLWNAADTVKHNRKECQRLARHATDVLVLIKAETKKGTPPGALDRLQNLEK